MPNIVANGSPEPKGWWIKKVTFVGRNPQKAKRQKKKQKQEKKHRKASG